MATATGFDDTALAARMRDAIRRLAIQTLDEERPPYRYGTVTAIYPDLRKVDVQFPGATTSVPVKVLGTQPVSTGQVVQVSGYSGDRFVSGVIGATRATDVTEAELAIPAGRQLAAGVERVTYSWTDVPEAYRYEVQFAEDAGFSVNVRTFYTSATAITLDNLNPGTSIWGRVRAMNNANGAGLYGTDGPVTVEDFPATGSDGSPPAASPDPVVTPGLGYLLAEWLPVANVDPVTYEVHLSTASGFTPSASTKVGETGSTFFFAKRDGAGALLNYDTTYFIRIIAKDADGAAGVSAQGSGQLDKVDTGDVGTIDPDAMTDGLPPASSPAATVTAGIGYLYATWPHVANQDPLTYEVHVSATSGFVPSSNTLVGETPSNWFFVRKQGPGAGSAQLAYGTTYYVKLVAKDADGAAGAGIQGSAAVLRTQNTDLQDAAVTTAKLGNLAVTSGKLADSSVLSTKLNDLAVTAAKLADGAVGYAKMAPNLRPIETVSTLPTLPNATYPVGSLVSLTTDGKLYRNVGGGWTTAVATVDLTGTITETQIADDAISTPKLQANAVTAAEIAAGTITATQIAANTITANQIAAGTITSSQIAADTIVAGNIAAGAIATSELAADAVTAIKIAAGAITTDKLFANAVTADKMAVGTITAASGIIADATITTAKIADLAVDSAKIANLAVTTAKIADLAVSQAKIASLAVGTAQIADASISTAKIQDLAVSSAKIASAAITTAKIQDAAITNAKIDALDASKITAGTTFTGDLNVSGLFTLTGVSAAFRSSASGRRVAIEDDDSLYAYHGDDINWFRWRTSGATDPGLWLEYNGARRWVFGADGAVSLDYAGSVGAFTINVTGNSEPIRIRKNGIPVFIIGDGGSIIGDGARPAVVAHNPGDNRMLLQLSSERPWTFVQRGTGAGTALELQSNSDKVLYITRSNRDIGIELHPNGGIVRAAKFEGLGGGIMTTPSELEIAGTMRLVTGSHNYVMDKFIDGTRLRLLAGGAARVDARNTQDTAWVAFQGSAFAVASSRRYKRDVAPTNRPDSVNLLRSLRPVKYRHAHARTGGPEDRLTRGFVVEDLPDELVIPALLGPSEAGEAPEANEDGTIPFVETLDDSPSWSVAEVVALLTDGLQDALDRIEALERGRP